MIQEKSIIQNIIILLFGYKYYANIVNTRGVVRTELCSFIFRSKEEAEEHRRAIENTVTYQFVETVSFRSRNSYYKKASLPTSSESRG